MDVAAYDPYGKPGSMAEAGVRPVDWGELRESSTAVSVHAPLTADTRAAVNGDALALAAPRDGAGQHRPRGPGRPG